MLPPQPAAGRRARPADPLVSFVVPVHDEAPAIDRFLAATADVVDRLAVRAEFVFANDGSTDATLARLLDRQLGDHRIRVVNLSRNFGKEAALTAGLEASRGDVLVPIDVDLQDPPELLGPFLDRWREGYDVVYGIRRDRSGDGLAKRVSAAAFYRVFNTITPKPIPENVGDFRLIDRRVADAILSLPERNRLMKAMFDWVGYPSIGVEYDRPARASGASSWTPVKLWNLALDGITSFSTLPLRVWTYVGLAISSGCLAYALLIMTLALTGRIEDVPGYASQLTVILFLGALQLISLGLIGEYVGRVLIETKRRPLYIVEGLYEAEHPTGPANQGTGPANQATGPANQATDPANQGTGPAGHAAEPTPRLAADRPQAGRPPATTAPGPSEV